MSLSLQLAAAVSFGLVVYAYAGYPLLLFLAGRWFPARSSGTASAPRTVSLLISCFNEAEVLRNKLDNALALEDPGAGIEIIVVSDASDDGTDEIAQEYAGRGVRLVRQTERRGKTSALNLAVPQARGEIIVFSDANAFYMPDAIKMLVRNLEDPKVGYVVGEARYEASEEASGSNETSYWNFEMWVKRIESRIHSVVGGDGAIYAIRAELYEPLRVDDINDFVNPLQIVSKGFRGVYEPEAVAWEETAGSFAKEFRRKARIVNRSFSGLMRTATVMNPFRTGSFSLLVVSHKLLRWIAPFFMVACFLACVSLALLGDRPFVWICLIWVAGYFVFYLSYLFHRWLGPIPGALFPYYFVMVNIASMRGVLNSFRGRVQSTWNSPRTNRDGAERDPGVAVGVHAFMAICVALVWRFLSSGLVG